MSGTPLLSIVSVVVYGEPGVGKTSLLQRLTARNQCDAADDEPFYVTIDEPTADAAIGEQIRRVYANADAGGSEELVRSVQRLIMRRRVAQYKEFLDDKLAAAMQSARLANRTALVVLCDGHTLTDSYLYVRSRIETGQLRDSAFLQHQNEQADVLCDVPSALRAPDAFVRLAMADRSGGTHHYRVCECRRSAAERDVPAREFARLARHADFAEQAMAQRFDVASTRIETDRCTPEAVVDSVRRFARRVVAQRAPTRSHTGLVVREAQARALDVGAQ